MPKYIWAAGAFTKIADAASVPTFVGPTISDIVLLLNQAMSPRDFSARFSATLPLTFSLIGGAITGLTLSAAGVLTGTPTVLGTYTLRSVRAADGTNPNADSNTFTIMVVNAITGMGDGNVGDGDVGDGDLGDGNVGS